MQRRFAVGAIKSKRVYDKTVAGFTQEGFTPRPDWTNTWKVTYHRKLTEIRMHRIPPPSDVGEDQTLDYDHTS
jgi:hypothetical protein